MKNTKKYKIIYALLILNFFAFGCSFGSAKAEEIKNENSKSVETGYKTKGKPNQPKTQNTDVSSVVGKYDYDTENDGEGYDNSLEITKADDGKLFVYIEGSYIYNIGETQSMHEAEGKGDAVLKGNIANATLVDEAGKLCRATITFKHDTADVKIPDTCQFNIALGGEYKKVDSENETDEAVKEKPRNENSKLRKVSYVDVMDFANDFDAHKVGEEFIIERVPLEILAEKSRADEFGNTSYKNLFYLQGVTSDDLPSHSFLTSKAMIENLKTVDEFETVVLRMTAAIAESRGKFDIYRIPFVTKIEGLSNEGDVVWTAESGEPAKLNFVH